MTREASARQLVLKHAIRLIPDDGARPRYRCQECQLSWHGRRDEHPVDDTCGVSVLVRDAAAGDVEGHSIERHIEEYDADGRLTRAACKDCGYLYQPAAAGETREEDDYALRGEV